MFDELVEAVLPATFTVVNALRPTLAPLPM